MAILLPTILAVSSLLQGPPHSSAVRIGPTVDRLSADDEQQIDRICIVDGAVPWLVQGYSAGWIRDQWYLTAYMPPDRTAPGIRYGKTCEVVAALAADGAYDAGPRKWQRARASPAREWAQVVVPGSDANEIQGSRDPDRPFVLGDTLSDDNLVAIVSAIRSAAAASPSTPTPGRLGSPLGSTQVESSWPISRILPEVRSGAVAVYLLGPDARERSGQVVTLRQVGREWVIASIGGWVSD